MGCPHAAHKPSSSSGTVAACARWRKTKNHRIHMYVVIPRRNGDSPTIEAKRPVEGAATTDSNSVMIAAPAHATIEATSQAPRFSMNCDCGASDFSELRARLAIAA
jgi:hypothetical protein